MDIYKEVDNSLLFDHDGELIFFVPENYFETNLANVVGSSIEILGSYNCALYDKNGKRLRLGVFDFPSMFYTQPHTIEKVKEYKIRTDDEPRDYRLLKYKKGDKIIMQLQVEKNIENVEDLFKLYVITGNGPDTLDYRDLYKIPINGMAINEGSFGLHYQYFGLMYSELCRDKDNPERPYRLSKDKKLKNWNRYKMVSIKDIPDYISPFVSLTSERFDDSVINAIMMGDEVHKYSPLEKVLTGKE